MGRRRVAGVDLGKASAKFALAHIEGDVIRVESQSCVSHEGDPLGAFASWYRESGAPDCVALGATGLYSDEILAPALSGLPEEACLEAALGVRADLEGPLNLLTIGARGYGALARDARGRISYVENDKCSSGTGETMVKTAARFGLSLDEADRTAYSAQDLIPITARCSVFAKSEMTHFGNQGRPVDALFRGYFDSIARYVAALVARVRAPGPFYLVGGPSRLRTLRDRLAEHLGAPIVVPEGALTLQALGAAAIAAEQARAGDVAALPQDPDRIVRPKQRSFHVLPAASDSKHRVTRLKAPVQELPPVSEPAVLGLDIGSTGSKAVLVSLQSGEIAHDVYDRTRGNPVEAAQRLVRTLLDLGAPEVRAIGVTGSGREAVATVLRASFPEQTDRIVVLNEIVAHATAAIRCDPDHGNDLSVVEIGGQDAKFAQITDGRIVESDMNKACSAGTGSFLEEQAAFYGVHDIDEFTSLAMQAERAPDLGQMCTVFVAEAAGEARAAGFEIPELFAGFQYSVVHNYLNRVMGQRRFGKRIFLQGKPASGPSLAWTLAAVTGREVFVPPNPGAMGAWGIGLCAIEALGADALQRASHFALSNALEASLAQREEFQCRDSRCGTLCNIQRTTVVVGDSKHVVFSGGACPKFELAGAGRPKLRREAPSAFDERDALLGPYFEDVDAERVVGIPHVGALTGLLPWARTFLAELGLGVRVLRPDAHSLQRGEERCYSYDACAPAKTAHGVADAGMDVLFLPRILDFDDPSGPGGKTCAMEQAIPAVVERALRARGAHVELVDPVVSLKGGAEAPPARQALERAARRLGVDEARVPRAMRRAEQAQRSYERALEEIGRRTLDYGRANGTAVVVVCGSLHVVHDPVINAGIPGILRSNGVLALPMDCYPVPAEIDSLPRIAWGDANRALRVSLAACSRGDAYPLLLSSFGCGPSSFVEQIFDVLMHGYPHTALESDGHGGNAGYVTRIQSFLHGVRQHDGDPAPVPERRLALLAPIESRPLADERDARLVTFAVGDRLGSLTAASYRSLGLDAVTAGPGTTEALQQGRRDCSGKECLPYQSIWGAFRKQLREDAGGKRQVLVQLTGEGACRNCMFSIKDRISLEHLGMSNEVSVRHLGSEGEAQNAFFARFWPAVVAWDVLHQLAAYHRPLEASGGEVDALYARYCDRLEALTEARQSAGARRWLEAKRHIDAIGDLLGEAAASFAQLAAAERPGLRTVLLTGDIYVRIDDFSSDRLVQRLNERGLRVLLDPAVTLVEYLGEERSAELLGLPTGVVRNGIIQFLMSGVRRRLYGRVRELHPWLPMPAVREALHAGRPVLDRYPRGEAPIAIGAVMHAWEQRHCDGVVVVGPWACGPSLISESLLRHEREIPMLFVYVDGSAVDERRLNGFAYRLRRMPPRAPEPSLPHEPPQAEPPRAFS